MWPFKYPYTNFHELNLDWILEEIQKTRNRIDSVKAGYTSVFDNIDSLKLNENKLIGPAILADPPTCINITENKIDNTSLTLQYGYATEVKQEAMSPDFLIASGMGAAEAVNKLYDNGATKVFLTGDISTSQGIVVPDNATFDGCMHKITPTSETMKCIQGGNNSLICNVTINGGAGYGIVHSKKQDAIVENVTVKNRAGICFGASECSNIEYRYCKALNNGNLNPGFWCDDKTSKKKPIRYIGCSAIQTSLDGFLLDTDAECYDCLADGCGIESTPAGALGSCGFYSKPTSGFFNTLIFSNCIAKNNGENGFYCSGIDKSSNSIAVMIEGCTTEDNGLSGFNIDGKTAELIFTGNRSFNNSTNYQNAGGRPIAGIFITGVNRGTITNNISYTTTNTCDYGITYKPSSESGGIFDAVIIANNNMRYNRNGGLNAPIENLPNAIIKNNIV